MFYGGRGIIIRSHNINKQKDSKNEAEYEESSVTHEVPSYFQIFKCGKNILNIIDVTYERVCMKTPKEKYFTKMLETLIYYNDHHNVPLFNEKTQQAFSKVMAETDKEERDAKCNSNNVNMDTFCQSPVTTNTQIKIVNMTNERRISSYILAETITYLKDLCFNK